MHSLIKWFAGNPVAANLLMLLIVIAGVFSLKTMRIEGFPAIPPSSVSVSTLYPGADGEQVDRGVTLKVERALEGMAGVRRISSYSSASLSTVTVEKVSSFPMDRFHNEISTRIETIDDLPQYAERPIVTRDEFNVEALVFQVYGDTDRATLQKIARKIRNRLLEHPKISRIQDFGLLDREIRIEIDEEKLRAYGLTPADVYQAINSGSLDYRTGEISSESSRIIVKADYKATEVSQFREVPLMTLENGSSLRIRDVAEVFSSYGNDFLYTRYNGKASVGFQVYSSKKGHLLQVSEAAHEIKKELERELPAGVKVDIWGEYSLYMQDRLSLLAGNAWQGLLIVFVILALFLNIKLAFWVAAGIPISIAGTMLIMGDRFLSYSLNDITTFGIIIVLGILVDDAIVVGESVFEERGKSSDALSGTVKGVLKVSTATTFGCFTTIAAFFPILLIDNELGKIFASFSVVVIVSLLVSLAESKLILPAHLAAIDLSPGKRGGRLSAFYGKVQKMAGSLLDKINDRFYRRSLKTVLRYRYAAVVILLTIAIAGGMAIGKGWIRTVFFPEVPGQIISVSLRMKSGSGRELIDRNIDRIEAAAEQLNREFMEKKGGEEAPIEKIMSYRSGPETAEFYAELLPEKRRKLGTMETLELWREKTRGLEGVESLVFSGSLETAGGFVLLVNASEEIILREAVQTISHRLSSMEGVRSISNSFQRGERRISLRLKEEASHLGLTAADLASQIGDAFGGLEVQRFQGDEEEVRVRILYGGDQRDDMRDLLNTGIFNSQGSVFPLSAVADIEHGYGPTSIDRRNGNRIVAITAELDRDLLTPSEAYGGLEDLIDSLEKSFPDLEVEGGGEIEEMGEIQGELIQSLLIILLLIYIFLAVPLKSYFQPFVIMSVIPFGFVGTLLGHYVMGHPLSLLSFFGMLAVAGVVVNDSLVLLTRYNELREEGFSMNKALVSAGTSRFRAIILTTLTTVCGLMPLLSETSEQASYLIPAAISLAWGELFATPVTLFIVPVLIRIGQDIKEKSGFGEKMPAAKAVSL